MAHRQALTVLLALLMLSSLFAGTTTGAVRATEGGAGLPSTDWPGPMAGQGRDGDRAELRITVGAFDPLADRLPSTGGLMGISSAGTYLVQFNAPLSPEVEGRLRTQGAKVLGFVPEHGLVVSLPRPAAALGLAAWDDVRWLGPWLDGWKVHPALEGAVGGQVLSVLTWNTGDDVTPQLRDAGARVLGHLHDHYIVQAMAPAISRLASLDRVCWIEPWTAPESHVDHAARTVGARQSQDGHLDPEGSSAWAYYPGGDEFEGLTGSSVTVDITDTGVDGSHHAFAGRIDAYSAIEPGRPDWSDPLGHGTHVAGIVLGDGSYRLGESGTLPDGKYAGMAPEARLIAQSLYGPGISFYYKNLTKWSVENDGDISQNSWGSFSSALWGNYTVISRDYDNATRDADWETPGNQSLLVVFAAGNSGYNGSAFFNNSVSPTASAKNVIAVGCVGNGKDPYSSEDALWLSSSRGYTDDGRIKPDLVAPGDNVTACWASEDGGALGHKPADSGTHSYINYGGTSMAAPVVSGAAALVMDHLRTKERHKDPSPALVKGILIASADHLPTEEWPGREQGWGRVNVTRAIVGGRTLNTEWIDQSTKFSSAGQSRTYRFEVGPDEPLRIALVWTDVTAATYTGKALVNDLDLQATSPSGKVYAGNVFSGGESQEGGASDRANNVEMVYLEQPETGEWQVKVSCHELPPVADGGVQDYALVTVGNVNKKFVDLAAQNLSVRATNAAEGDVVPIIFDLANLGNLPAPVVAYQLNVLDEGGKLVERLRSGVVDLAPHAGARIHANWTAVRGTYTVKAVPNPFRHVVEESYQNNNMSKGIFIKGFGTAAVINSPLATALPGRDASFEINVTNTGNVEDLFLLDRSVPPPGWSARLDATVLDIQAGKTSKAHLIVTVPEGAMAWESARINVTIVSQGNSTHQVELSTETQALPVYGMTLDMDVRTQNAIPGENITFQFQVHNTGNAPDTYRVSYVQKGGPTDGVSFSLPRTTFSIPSGATQTGNLTIALDAGSAMELPMNEKITFDIVVSSISGGSLRRTITGSVVIQQLHAVTVPRPPEDEFYIMPGEATIVTLTFVNEGNGPEMIAPGVVLPIDWEWDYDGSAFNLVSGEAKQVSLRITAPDSAEAAVHTVTARAMAGDEALASHDFRFHVDWVPGLSARLHGGFDRNLTRGKELAMDFTVTNTGNAADTVTVDFLGLTFGLRVDARPDSVDLLIGESADITVVFNASRNAELLQGEYDIVFVYAQEVERLTVSVNITIKIASGTGPSRPDGEDGGDGSLAPMVWIGILVAMLAVVMATVAIIVTRRRTGQISEEDFFVPRRETSTAEMLREERTSTERPPPPPPPTEPPDRPAPPPPPVAQATGSHGCPECGNPMESLRPAGSGMYCPTCGHKEEGS